MSEAMRVFGRLATLAILGLTLSAAAACARESGAYPLAERCDPLLLQASNAQGLVQALCTTRVGRVQLNFAGDAQSAKEFPKLEHDFAWEYGNNANVDWWTVMRDGRIVGYGLTPERHPRQYRSPSERKEGLWIIDGDETRFLVGPSDDAGSIDTVAITPAFDCAVIVTTSQNLIRSEYTDIIIVDWRGAAPRVERLDPSLLPPKPPSKACVRDGAGRLYLYGGNRPTEGGLWGKVFFPLFTNARSAAPPIIQFTEGHLSYDAALSVDHIVTSISSEETNVAGLDVAPDTCPAMNVLAGFFDRATGSWRIECFPVRGTMLRPVGHAASGGYYLASDLHVYRISPTPTGFDFRLVCADINFGFPYAVTETGDRVFGVAPNGELASCIPYEGN